MNSTNVPAPHIRRNSFIERAIHLIERYRISDAARIDRIFGIALAMEAGR